jgi:hypothetical protein
VRLFLDLGELLLGGPHTLPDLGQKGQRRAVRLVVPARSRVRVQLGVPARQVLLQAAPLGLRFGETYLVLAAGLGEDLLLQRRVSPDRADAAHDKLLDLGGRQRGGEFFRETFGVRA